MSRLDTITGSIIGDLQACSAEPCVIGGRFALKSSELTFSFRTNKHGNVLFALMHCFYLIIYLKLIYK